nr:MAG TPA: hypothetical protein [Caudoviricetes sp.]
MGLAEHQVATHWCLPYLKDIGQVQGYIFVSFQTISNQLHMDAEYNLQEVLEHLQ